MRWLSGAPVPGLAAAELRAAARAALGSVQLVGDVSSATAFHDAKNPNEPMTANVCHFDRTEIPFAPEPLGVCRRDSHLRLD